MEKILIGISGGVDSSVVATKLKEEGHEIVAVMMQVYKGENLSEALNSCYGISKEKEISDAKNICEKLDIDFHLIDCTQEFNELVFKVFQSEYAAGRTPNPCVLCNPNVKFGALPKIAKEKGVKFDKFATGHYARIKYDDSSGRYLLYRAIEPKKDQSYFLYGLKQEQLSKILFPLGNQTKEQTREYARKKGLITFDKEDSQDFFKGDYAELLDQAPSAGEIVLQDGTVLGKHEGIHHFTVGQRKGLKVAFSEPLYVIELDAKNNNVIVGTKNQTFSDSLIAKQLNWIAFENLPEKLACAAKHRSTQNPQKCCIESQGIDKVKVVFDEPQSSITPGQSVVFYDNDLVLGGGIIESAL